MICNTSIQVGSAPHMLGTQVSFSNIDPFCVLITGP